MHNDEEKNSHKSFNPMSNSQSSFGPIALVAISVLTVLIFLWGEIVADPQIDVYQFEFTLASLRYSLGELRPKETTNHTMF